MATLPGKSGPGSNVADLSSKSGNLTPELAELLGDPQFETFLKSLAKAHKSYNSSGRHDSNMAAVSNNMQTGERRAMIPPSAGRKELTNKQMYAGRPKAKKGGNALDAMSLAEQEMTYESTPENPQALRPEAMLGPGVPIPGEGEVLGKGREAEAMLRAQAIPSAGRSDSTSKMLGGLKERGLVSPRNVPLGMPDYDLNQGQGGEIPGVETTAGEAALLGDMQGMVETMEAGGRPPDNSAALVTQFLKKYGKEHPLYQRMAAATSQAMAQ